MRFSIVIPVYNKQDFLKSCFDSIEAQTCRDFEVVLVDDGSSDASSRMCDEFAEIASMPVTVIHKRNEGLMRARHDGIQAATGEYIINHDADDDLRDICVEAIDRRLSETGADVAWFCFSAQPDYGDRIGVVDVAEESRSIDLQQARMLICEGAHNAIDTKVARRDLMRSLDVYDLYPQVMIGEDLLQSACLYSRDLTTAYVSDSLVYYNQNEQSSTRNYSRKTVDDVVAASGYLIDRASEWGEDFFQAAYAGAVRQICGAASMIMASSLDGGSKAEELRYLSDKSAALVSCNVRDMGLSAYHERLFEALSKGRIRAAKALVGFRNLVRH